MAWIRDCFLFVSFFADFANAGIGILWYTYSTFLDRTVGRGGSPVHQCVFPQRSHACKVLPASANSAYCSDEDLLRFVGDILVKLFVLMMSDILTDTIKTDPLLNNVD